MGEYKVFRVDGGFQIFWCPSAPVHYADRIPYDGKVYSTKQAAHKRKKQLSDELKQSEREKKSEEAIA